jgi:hypothetical protein
MVDTLASGASHGNMVEVRILFPAPRASRQPCFVFKRLARDKQNRIVSQLENKPKYAELAQW